MSHCITPGYALGSGGLDYALAACECQGKPRSVSAPVVIPDQVEVVGLWGMGADAAGVSDAHKKAMTRQVRDAERTWSQVEAGERDMPSGFSGGLDVLRQALTTRRWSDSSWLPEVLGGWPTSSELLERVNRLHRLAIQRRRPGAIAPGAIDSRGRVRQDSPTAAGARTFVTEAGRTAGELGTNLGGALARGGAWIARNPGKSLAIVAGGAALIYLAGQYARGAGSRPRRRRGSNPRRRRR